MSQMNENDEVMKVPGNPTIWVYNGNEFEFDAGDADIIENYEDVLNQFDQEAKLLKKDGSNSERLREYDLLFRNMFDRIFGEGAGDAILGERRSVFNCNTAFADFLDFVASQKGALEASYQKTMSKHGYSPNRAQRRAVKYHHHA